MISMKRHVKENSGRGFCQTDFEINTHTSTHTHISQKKREKKKARHDNNLGEYNRLNFKIYLKYNLFKIYKIKNIYIYPTSGVSLRLLEL